LDNVSAILDPLFRWIHILAGIIWIGMLYFFNFVNGPFAATMDGDTKKKVVPELMPRALWWFRIGAAWTWVTGILLLGLVFHSSKVTMFGTDDGGIPRGWSAGAGISVLLVFLAPGIYDFLQKSFGKDPKVFGAISFVLLAVVAALMALWGGLTYRALNIHLAGLMGTIMAFNVWQRIWPAQQQIIKGIKGDGPAAPPELVAFAATRSRHNVYMSVPLFWGMINSHTTAFAGGRFGIPTSYSFVVYLLVILIGWHIVYQLYKRAPKVKGF
jgi:uncharacterized membrane protein